tara:strand:+ start:59 stop:688 length:630 start_codon:yes stop_codon:yes gene_type:complete
VKKIFILIVFFINLNEISQAEQFITNYHKGKFLESFRNNFLVASEKLNEGRFAKTVIVMFAHDKGGALGLVVNKPLGVTPINEIVKVPKNFSEKQKNLLKKKIPVYWGGPVNKNKVFILHTNEYSDKSTIKIRDLSISSDYETLLKIAENKGPKKNLIVIGLSSWGPEQLEGEFERESWVLSEINEEIVFEIENSEKWKKALKNSYLKL